MSGGSRMPSTGFFFLLIGLTIGSALLIVLFLIATGNFAPFMTSELGEFGICETHTAVEPLPVIQASADTLYICGELVGETKRDIGFDVFFEGHGKYTRSVKLEPGPFFIPICVSRLFPDQQVFPPGDYQLRAAYYRDPSLFVNFVVSEYTEP